MKTILIGLALVLGCSLGGKPIAADPYDLLLHGGRVMDGSGNPWFEADVAIRDGRIVAVGKSLSGDSKQSIDVGGSIVCPGFIDLHSHMGDRFSGSGNVWKDDLIRSAPNLVAQGITTVVINPDGSGPLDIGKQRANWEQHGQGPNMILLVGHNSLRRHVLGKDNRRPASPAEIEQMRQRIRSNIAAGAWGMSAGLEYSPGIWSTSRELVELCRELAPSNGVFIVHERSSGADPFWWFPSQHAADTKTTMLENILELIYVSELSGVTTVATHIKARGQNYWGSSGAMIRAINAARGRGVNIYADQYPYNTSGSDGRLVLIPKWFFDSLSTENRQDYSSSLNQGLADPETNEKIRMDIAHTIRRRGGPERIVVMESVDDQWTGNHLAQLAKQLKMDPVDVAIHLQLAGDSSRRGGVRLRSYSMSEADVEALAAQPWCATATDAGVTRPDAGTVHARFYGTFPRKIRHYAIDRGIMTVENAIRSATSLPAQILGIRDRGMIREGHHADIVVFDPVEIRDTATFEQPHSFPEGIKYVFVGGQAVVDAGARTGKLPGSVLVPASAKSAPLLGGDAAE